MALNLKGIKNFLFKQSRSENLGMDAKGVEQYKNYPATTFLAARPSSNDVIYSAAYVTCVDNAQTFYGTANLPDGAVIIAAIVTGNVNETWRLKRIPLDGSEGSAGTQLVTANMNTEGQVTSKNQVNNELYSYTFQVETLDATERIYGGRITYTL